MFGNQRPFVELFQAMLNRLKVYQTDANPFTEIYGKLKTADTLESTGFVKKSKKTYQEGAVCSVCKKPITESP